MKVLVRENTAEINVKNSRFIAEAFIVTTQAEAREKLLEQKKRYSDASHVCHSFICGKDGQTSGMSDDGEPSGTAGRPMLDVLKGSCITNILITVTRYFGGTLLGTGGLVRAYSDSVKAVLSICETEELVEKSSFSFTADYHEYQSIKRIFEAFSIENLNEDYSDLINVSGTIHKSQAEDFSSRIKDLSRGKITIIVE
ncbi:MAG: YigZ family protein [Treponema sp.]|nr:YigZ family protein [Treponema sp.]